MTIEEFLTAVTENEPEILRADGFDEAIIGTVQCKGRATVLCYDYAKCVEILCERDGMEYDDAVEFMEFNVVDAYVGEHTPAFLNRR